VTSALAEAFRSEIPCSHAVAIVLASLARERVGTLGGTAEDSDEDLVLRLRDPRSFGAFAESVSNDLRVELAVREALVEHVFDLLPLPRTEGEVISVESRAPRHLVAFAASLAEAGELTVLHIMHLVYAVFLDRSLVTEVPRKTRSAVLRAVVSGRGSDEALRVLYACLSLSAVPVPEAASELRRILKTTSVPLGLRRNLARIASDKDGGQSGLTRMAQQQGLIPGDLRDPEAPEILANIPRLPAQLSAPSVRFLRRVGPV